MPISARNTMKLMSFHPVFSRSRIADQTGLMVGSSIVLIRN